MNSFRIKKRDDSLGTGTVPLKTLVYEEWLQKYADDEFNTAQIYVVYLNLLYEHLVEN